MTISSTFFAATFIRGLHSQKDKLSFLWFKSSNGIIKHIPFTFPILKNPPIFMPLEACLNLGFLCYELTETGIS